MKTIHSTILESNGFKYHVVWGTLEDGQPFVAVPGLKAAAIMTPYPVEHGYIMEKLGISEPDALAVLNAIHDY